MAFSMMQKPMDYDKFLDEYRANLQLQINNNNRVYNAVSQVNQGIQLPEQPPDMRSLSEKIGDVQNLKNQLSVQLRQITDGSNADMIVNRLSDDELARAVQYFQTLAQKLKSSYALGVPADVFIQALQNYSDVQDESAGIDMGLQGLQKQSDKILLSLKNIQDHGLKPDSVKKLIKFGKAKRVVSPAQMLTLQELEKIMFSLDDLKRISRMAPDMKSELDKKLSDIYPKLPTQQEFDNLWDRLQTFSDPAQQVAEFNNIVTNMSGLTEADAEVLREYKGVTTKGGLRFTGKQAVAMKKASKEMLAQMKARKAEKKTAKEAAKAAAVSSPSPVPSMTSVPSPVSPQSPPPPTPPRTPSKKGIPTGWSDVLKLLRESSSSRSKILMDLEDAGYEFEYKGQPISREDLYKGRIPNEPFNSQVNKNVGYWEASNVKALVKQYNERVAPQQGKGMRGRGMVSFSEPSEIVEKPKTKKAIRISGKIEKPIEFVPFGKYAIHRFKLNDGILMLRSKSNNTIPTIPPQKIGKNMADILKQVVIGGTPSFEAISGLDANDKEILHKIVRLSHVELSVPTPDLTKKEQDNHRFQLLRGQLVAGNNSKELIRELKGLLLKFISAGTIPKAQANAVLFELMNLS